jgi:hypothetical protein
MKSTSMFKATAFLALLLCFSARLFAQVPPTYEERPASGGGFNKNNLFLGGSLNLGFGSNSYFNIGGTPEIGYSFSEWIDAGIALNLNYYTIKDYGGNKARSFNYGGGVFARLFPIRNFFVQLQPEYNWARYTEEYSANGQKLTATHGAPSILAGVGYAQRIIGSTSFYTAILFDINNDPYSPYRDAYTGNIIPIIRAGFNIYLRPSR